MAANQPIAQPLSAIIKQRGVIWLGLTNRVVSIRPYPHIADIGRMVSRSAYAELRFSPWRLLGTLAGMIFTYVAPPMLTVFASGYAQLIGGAAWLLMAISFQPTLRLYRRSRRCTQHRQNGCPAGSA